MQLVGQQSRFLTRTFMLGISRKKACEISHFREKFHVKYCMRNDKFRGKLDPFRETNSLKTLECSEVESAYVPDEGECLCEGHLEEEAHPYRHHDPGRVRHPRSAVKVTTSSNYYLVKWAQKNIRKFTKKIDKFYSISLPSLY